MGDKTSAKAGEIVKIKATADAGYELKNVSVTTSDFYSIAVSGNTFVMPKSDVTINASFWDGCYQIRVAEGIEHGSIRAWKTKAMPGEKVPINVKADDGCGLKTLIVRDDYNSNIKIVLDSSFVMYENRISHHSDYSFVMPEGDVTISGSFSNEPNKFHESVTVLPYGTSGTAGSSGTYVYFGVWPQTIKASNVTVDETKTVAMGAFTYCLGSDGNYYAKCTENAYGTSCTYSNGTTVAKSSANSTKWFKVEPIKWRVLNPDASGNKILLAEKILTASVLYYDYPNVNRTIDSATVYSNNYKYSAIRAYLNGLSYEVKSSSSATQTTSSSYLNKGFLQTAFTTTAQKLIATTTVDNSAASTTDAGGNITQATNYACGNTSDKIFLLSEKEVTTTDYGFANSSGGVGNARIRMPTDFAKANYGGGGLWWLRSPYYDYSYSVRYVSTNGDVRLHTDQSISADFGVCPALSISF